MRTHHPRASAKLPARFRFGLVALVLLAAACGGSQPAATSTTQAAHFPLTSLVQTA